MAIGFAECRRCRSTSDFLFTLFDLLWAAVRFFHNLVRIAALQWKLTYEFFQPFN